jgi:hypothetical protein
MAKFMYIGEKPAILEYLGAQGDQGGSSPWTFTSKTFGSAASDRRIIVAVFAPSTSTVNLDAISGVTIGGVTATRIAAANSSNDFHQIAFYIADVPTGTSGNIVITTSGGRASMSIAWYKVTQLKSATAVATDFDNTTSAATLSTDVQTKKGGFVLAAAMRNGGGGSWTMTGVSENQDSPFPVDPASGATMVAGSAVITTPSSLSVTASPNATNATETLLTISMR